MFLVHRDLPREGPGNRESTARALAMVPEIPAAAEVLDIGCGPGRQTLDLAALLPRARVLGVDAHAGFVEDGVRRAARAGVSDRVRFAVGDMRALDVEPGTFDLLWCEGAAYIMGVEAALAAWRPLLKVGGCLAFTDAVWLTDSAPQTLRTWWQSEYPGMRTLESGPVRVTDAGYALCGQFVLPEAAWWDDYYKPMESRLASLRVEMESEPAALAALAEHQREIDYYRRWSDHYGYQFVVARRIV